MSPPLFHANDSLPSLNHTSRPLPLVLPEPPSSCLLDVNNSSGSFGLYHLLAAAGLQWLVAGIFLEHYQTSSCLPPAFSYSWRVLLFKYQNRFLSAADLQWTVAGISCVVPDPILASAGLQLLVTCIVV